MIDHGNKTFEFSGQLRDPESFDDGTFEVVQYSDNTVWITWTREGKKEGSITLPSHILSQVSWMYLDHYYKSRMLMSGLKSFWDIITIAESRQRIKLYQLTPAGFKRLWGKYLKEGIL